MNATHSTRMKTLAMAFVAIAAVAGAAIVMQTSNASHVPQPTATAIAASTVAVPMTYDCSVQHQSQTFCTYTGMCDDLWADVLFTSEGHWVNDESNPLYTDAQEAALYDFWVTYCVRPKPADDTGYRTDPGDPSTSPYSHLSPYNVPHGHRGTAADPSGESDVDDPLICGFDDDADNEQSTDGWLVYWDHFVHAQGDWEWPGGPDEDPVMVGIYSPEQYQTAFEMMMITFDMYWDGNCDPVVTTDWECGGFVLNATEGFEPIWAELPDYQQVSDLFEATTCDDLAEDSCVEFEGEDFYADLMDVPQDATIFDCSTLWDWLEQDTYAGLLVSVAGGEMCDEDSDDTDLIWRLLYLLGCIAPETADCGQMMEWGNSAFPGGMPPGLFGDAFDPSCIVCAGLSYTGGPSTPPFEVPDPGEGMFENIDWCDLDGDADITNDFAFLVDMTSVCNPFGGGGGGTYGGPMQWTPEDLLELGKYWAYQFDQSSCTDPCDILVAGVNGAFQQQFGRDMAPSETGAMLDMMPGCYPDVDDNCQDADFDDPGDIWLIAGLPDFTDYEIPLELPGDVSPTIPCDLNGDNEVTPLDLQIFLGKTWNCNTGGLDDPQLMNATGVFLGGASISDGCPFDADCEDIIWMMTDMLDTPPTDAEMLTLLDLASCLPSEPSDPNVPINSPPFDIPVRAPGDPPLLCGANPTETLNPVDLAHGHKHETVADFHVRVAGPDFYLTRSYSSQPDLTGPSMMGGHWSQDVLNAASYTGGPSYGNTSGSWVSRAGGAVYPVVWGNHGGDWQTCEWAQYQQDDWFLYADGEWEVRFHGASTPADPTDGLPKQWRDSYGNTRDFSYSEFEVSGWTTKRLSRINLNGQGDDAEAIIEFNWTGSIADLGSGSHWDAQLSSVRVLRDVNDEWVETQRIDYTYASPDDVDAVVKNDLGTTGDLIQVVHTVNVDRALDGDADRHTIVTQYRYYNEDSTDGAEGQLKMVILPEQIEFAHQQINSNGPSTASILETAELLLTMDDDDFAFTDTGGAQHSLASMAAKIIKYYTSGDNDGKVSEQQLNVACGCGGADSAGLKMEYAYTEYTVSEHTADFNGRTMTVVEKEIDGGTTTTHRTRYYDLYEHNPESDGPFYHLANSVVREDLGGSSHRDWVTHYVYDTSGSPPTYDLLKIMTPSAMTEDGYDSVDDGDYPSYDPETDAGLVYSMTYNGDRLVTEIAFGNGELGAHSNFTPLIAYEYPTTPYYLPSSIKRYYDDGASDYEELAFLYELYDAPSGTYYIDGGIEWIETAVAPDLTSENGPGGSATSYAHAYFNILGQNEWSGAADGALTYRTFDSATGTLTEVRANPDLTALPQGVTVPAEPAGLDFDNAGRNGDGGELISEFKRDLLGRLTAVIDPAGVETRIVREVRPHFERFGANYYTETVLPHYLASSSPAEFEGPAVVTWYNAGGSPIASSAFELKDGASEDWSFDGIAYGTYDYALDAEVTRSTIQHASNGQIDSQRTWHRMLVESGGSVTDPGAYYTTNYEYDPLGRLTDIIAPTGSRVRRAFDVLDRLTNIQVGTTVANLVDVTDLYYDGDDETTSTNVGNSNLSKVIESVAGSETRSTLYSYDFRDRIKIVEPVMSGTQTAPLTQFTYDLMSRPVTYGLFTASTTDGNDELLVANRILHVETAYSTVRGLPWRRRVLTDPDLASPANDDYLTSFTWFDESGRAVGARQPDSPMAKIGYDALGRAIDSYLIAIGHPSSYSDVYTAATYEPTITNNDILKHYHSDYNTDGLLELVTSSVSAHDAYALGSSHSSDETRLIETYVGRYFDDAARVSHIVDFGTNQDGFEYTPDTASPPSVTGAGPTPGTDQIDQIVKIAYNSIGLTDTVTDPEGKITKQFYDAALRPIGSAQNFVNADITGWNATDQRWDISGMVYNESDKDVLTTYVYNGADAMVKRIAHTFDGQTAKIQITEYVYGATSSGTYASDIDSNDLLSAIHFPDPDPVNGGAPSTAAADTAHYVYNRLGEVKWFENQEGVKHTYTRDDVGRVTSDAVSFSGPTDIDDTIKAIAQTFNTKGLVEEVFSYSTWDPVTPSNNIVANALQYEYTDLFEIDRFYQDPSGEIDLDGGGLPTGDTHLIDYTYQTTINTTTNVYQRRLTQMEYPTGTEKNFEYGGAGSVNYLIGRLFKVKLGTTEVMASSYLGAGYSEVIRDLAQPDVMRDHWVAHNGERNGGKYDGLDRFGRIRKTVWADGSYDEHASDTTVPNIPPIIEQVYSYQRDQDPDIEYYTNIVSKADGRPGVDYDDPAVRYHYDGIYKLTKAERGVLNADNDISTHDDNSEAFTLDVIGNITKHEVDIAAPLGTFNGSDLHQDGEFNLTNEIEELTDLAVTPSVDLLFAYDDAGNLREQDLTSTTSIIYTHDAWNRPVAKEFNDGTTTHQRVQTEYNGAHQRTIERSDSDVTDATHELNEQRFIIHDPGWNMILEYIDDGYEDSSDVYADTDRLIEYIWAGLNDLLIRRQDDTKSGTFDGTRYTLTDYQGSVIAEIDETGDLENYIEYSPYGVAQVYALGDMDRDGNRDAADRTVISDIARNAPGGAAEIEEDDYDARADLNRDGVVNSSDVSLASGDVSTLSAGVLSDSDLRIGYTGAVFQPSVMQYHMRYRDYDPTTMRFIQRDPLGYIDGSSMYEYVGGNPVSFTDPFGLSRGSGMFYDLWNGFGDRQLARFTGWGYGPKPPGWGSRKPGGSRLLDAHDPNAVNPGSTNTCTVYALQIKIVAGSRTYNYIYDSSGKLIDVITRGAGDDDIGIDAIEDKYFNAHDKVSVANDIHDTVIKAGGGLVFVAMLLSPIDEGVAAFVVVRNAVRYLRYGRKVYKLGDEAVESVGDAKRFADRKSPVDEVTQRDINKFIDDELANRPQLFKHPKHHPNRAKGNVSPEPIDAGGAYTRAIEDTKGTWWSVGDDGSIYRYSRSGDGTVHWSGGTGRHLRKPIRWQDVPHEIREALGVKP